MRPILPLIAAAGALLAGGSWLLTREARWRSPTYCIERPGHLWAGEAGELPGGYVASCPESSTYPMEVRRGETRVELYTAPGWRPYELEGQLKRAGWRPLDAEYVNADLYEAFLEKNGKRVYYLASRQAGTTFVTLNGRP